MNCPHCKKDITKFVEDEEEKSENYGLVFPTGCQCDKGTWWGAVSVEPICARYVGKLGKHCETCEHDSTCHEGEEKDHA
jgi:hypothetical protein